MHTYHACEPLDWERKRDFEEMSITIRNGYKYAICEQCELEWNVSWQFVGWYVCPICAVRNRRGKDVRNRNCQQSDIGTASSEQALAAAEK